MRYVRCCRDRYLVQYFTHREISHMQLHAMAPGLQLASIAYIPSLLDRVFTGQHSRRGVLRADCKYNGATQQ